MTTWHITKGAPTVEETAALTTVLVTVLSRVAAVGQAARTTPEKTGAGWHRPDRGRHPSTGMWRGR
ncbi:acyl-CoA carboxylase subunit epsilon [Streptomyces sp. NPDC088746]|uniref:acyl-CoA carboxylase subunit epsilon n=1 Tax=Streptomyces sp. NPDC088746 TaxID=3365885 RepID=UPI00382D4692